MAIPVISVVGRSGTGKTTLLERLIRELKARGYRVATVKHDTHSFDIDQPGKDSWRHAQAGSDVVVISAPDRIATLKRLDRELTLDEIVGMISDVDIILTEGYKRGDKPKIEVVRSELSNSLISRLDNLIAVVTDGRLGGLSVPCFAHEDVEDLTDLLEQRFLKAGNSAAS